VCAQADEIDVLGECNVSQTGAYFILPAGKDLLYLSVLAGWLVFVLRIKL